MLAASMRILVVALSVLGCGGSTAVTPADISDEPHRAEIESIHPHCVDELVFAQGRNPVRLTECGQAVGDVTLEGTQHIFVPAVEGVRGREVQGFEVLGAIGDDFVLRYIINGGGTGYFTGIVFVRLDGDTLTSVGTIAGGDRCNHGLVAARVDHDAVEFSQSFTPMDVISASVQGQALEAEAQLESSANSCVAVARYRWQHGRATLIDVTFNQPALTDREGWTERFLHQSCFNQIVAEYARVGSGPMTPAEVDRFVQTFRERCVSSRPE